MSMGVRALDRSVHKASEWLTELDEIFGWNDKDKTHKALRATLHALRDRLQINEAVQLGAQMPHMFRGIFYDGWRPSESPNVERNLDKFLDRIEEEYSGQENMSPQKMARAVFQLLENRISAGEIEDVKGMMPDNFQPLWPSSGGASQQQPPSGGARPGA